MTRADAIVSRPPDDLPEARVWRPDLMVHAEDRRPGLPVQPALFPLPRRASSRRPAFSDLLDTARLDPAGSARRPGGGTVQLTVVGAAPGPDLPDVRRWSVNLGLAVIEVLLGHRPLAQLLRWLGDGPLGVLGLAASARPDHAGSTAARERIAVVSARVQIVTPEVVEVCLHATRTAVRYVLAYRLVAVGGRWLCTELELLTPRRYGEKSRTRPAQV